MYYVLYFYALLFLQNHWCTVQCTVCTVCTVHMYSYTVLLLFYSALFLYCVQYICTAVLLYCMNCRGVVTCFTAWPSSSLALGRSDSLRLAPEGKGAARANWFKISMIWVTGPELFYRKWIGIQGLYPVSAWLWSGQGQPGNKKNNCRWVLVWLQRSNWNRIATEKLWELLRCMRGL